jgi:hypothetical protein
MLGYKIHDSLGNYRRAHIWINEIHEGETYGNGKVRVAVGALDDRPCEYYTIPDQFYQALFEASRPASPEGSTPKVTETRDSEKSALQRVRERIDEAMKKMENKQHPPGTSTLKTGGWNIAIQMGVNELREVLSIIDEELKG